jgi:hypothetical protein
MAVDTGATFTTISTSKLLLVGYQPVTTDDSIPVTTGSSIIFLPVVRLESLISVGEVRADFPVLSHTLPPTAGVDGLLGLDFFRDRRLTLDFRQGRLTVD